MNASIPGRVVAAVLALLAVTAIAFGGSTGKVIG